MVNRKSLAVFLFIFLSNFGYAYAQAYPEICDPLLVDESGILGRQFEAVENAAKKVQDLGATVRIRVYSSTRYGENLDFLQEELESKCLSWRAPDGGTRNNLISLLLSVEDRGWGFFVGSQWANSLNRGVQNRLEDNYVFPRFRDNDFSGALIAGLEQITSILDAQAKGSVVGSGATAVIVQTEPTDFTGLWWVLFSIVLVGLVGGAFVVVQNKRKEEEKRRAAQQKALMAKRNVSGKVNSAYDALPVLEARIGALAQSVSENELSTLKNELAGIKQTVDSTSEAFTRIGMGKTDAEQNTLSAQEYVNIESEYNKLSSVVIPTAELETKLNNLARLSKELEGRLEVERVLLEGVNSQISAIEKEGFKADAARGIYKQACCSREEAGRAFSNGDHTNSDKLLKDAENGSNEALAAAKILPETRATILKDIDQIKTEIDKVNKFIDSGHAAFSAISAEFAEACWESVRGNGVEAEERLESARESVEEVAVLASMEHQKWDQALDLITETSKQLKETVSLIRSIIALEKSLKNAKNDCQKEVQVAHTDIRNAWEYINQHDADISEQLEVELKDAEEILHSAVMELEKSKPNYLKVVKDAQMANEIADKILVNARSEHEAMERLRQKAETSLRDATAACSKAREYIEDHSSDVGVEAKQRLNQATAKLPMITSTGDLEVKIKFAKDAEVLADDAYKGAQKNVDDAEEERDRARRRQAAASISVNFPRTPTYKSSPSRSSSPSLGSSRSWGSSSSRTGGSRSFSGGGGRVGGSRKW